MFKITYPSTGLGFLQEKHIGFMVICNLNDFVMPVFYL